MAAGLTLLRGKNYNRILKLKFIFKIAWLPVSWAAL